MPVRGCRGAADKADKALVASKKSAKNAHPSKTSLRKQVEEASVMDQRAIGAVKRKMAQAKKAKRKMSAYAKRRAARKAKYEMLTRKAKAATQAAWDAKKRVQRILNDSE